MADQLEQNSFPIRKAGPEAVVMAWKRGSDGKTLAVNEDTPLPVNVSVTAESTAEATAAAPSYTEGQDAPLSQDRSGNLRVIPSNAATAATAAKQDTQIAAEQAILAKLQVGATNVSVVRATSTGTAATLVVARPTRAGLLIRNLDTANSVWVGPATVTTANGFLIKAGESLPLTWVGLLQIIDNGSHADVAVIDEYY